RRAGGPRPRPAVAGLAAGRFAGVHVVSGPTRRGRLRLGRRSAARHIAARGERPTRPAWPDRLEGALVAAPAGREPSARALEGNARRERQPSWLARLARHGRARHRTALAGHATDLFL